MLESPPHNGTTTSIAAAQSMVGKTELIRERIFDEIAKAGASGLTRDEITEKTGIAPNTVRPRVVELMDSRRLYVSFTTRPTASGRQAQVLCAVSR